jgi:YesN/AraC family two-component response regulator
MGKKTILLVEDDSMVRDLIRGALERQYNVLEAATCSEAIQKIKSPIHLALIDYNLPDADGFDVLRAIREVKPELPAILMAAYSTDNLVAKALRAGVTDFIRKPLSFAYLRGKLSELLEGKENQDNPDQVRSSEVFVMDCIAAFIEENFDKDMCRNELAEKAHMERHKFSRAFNAHHGKTFKSHLNSIRVNKAAELLKKNIHLSVTDIAISVGYNSVSHFEKVFREAYGTSPSRYRKNQTSSHSEV